MYQGVILRVTLWGRSSRSEQQVFLKDGMSVEQSQYVNIQESRP